MSVQIRGLFSWPLIFLSVVILFVSSLAARPQDICLSDLDCATGEFCQWRPGIAKNQGMCQKCFDCSSVHRKSFEGCVRSERECRSCELGFVQIDNQCHHAGTQTAPTESAQTTDSIRQGSTNEEHTMTYSTAALIIIPVLILVTVISTAYARTPRQARQEELTVSFRRDSQSAESLVSISGTENSSQPSPQMSCRGANSPIRALPHYKSTIGNNIKSVRPYGRTSCSNRIPTASRRLIIERNFQQATPLSPGDPNGHDDDVVEIDHHNNPGQHLGNQINVQEILAQAAHPPSINQDAGVPQVNNHLPEESIPLAVWNGENSMQGNAAAPPPSNLVNPVVAFHQLLQQIQTSNSSNSNAQGEILNPQVVPQVDNPSIPPTEAFGNNVQDLHVIESLSDNYDFSQHIPAADQQGDNEE